MLIKFLINKVHLLTWINMKAHRNVVRCTALRKEKATGISKNYLENSCEWCHDHSNISNLLHHLWFQLGFLSFWHSRWGSCYHIRHWCCVIVSCPSLPVQLYEELELLRLVYYGGVEPSIRKEVWPFLLGHYTFTMTPEERKEVCVFCFRVHA